jgi:hypothetical protein
MQVRRSTIVAVIASDKRIAQTTLCEILANPRASRLHGNETRLSAMSFRERAVERDESEP